MPPNFSDAPFERDPENQSNGVKDQTSSKITLIDNLKENYKLRIFYSSLNLLAHTLIGAVTGVSIFFAFRNGLPLSTTQLHIVLCVIGYQLLMSQAFLALSPHNGWSANLKLVDKRRAHWILQILGSGLAIAGSIIMMLEKNVNFNTLHGKFALVAFVFTIVCFFNGLTSSYAYELRRFLPANLSKLTHICFGIVAFATASISLCYGFDKASFRNWVTPGLTPTIIAFTAAFTAIVILNPLVVFVFRSMSIIKKLFHVCIDKIRLLF